MTRNVELLQQTMRHILDHPESHDQSSFIDECGTAACFAGRAALLSGWSLERIDRSPMWYEGAKLLGLTHVEAYDLFEGGNTRSMLELMVKDLVDGHELRTPSYYRDEADHVSRM